jgi:hypothetical protein
MTGRPGVNKLVRDLHAHGCHQISVPLKESQMLLVRRSDQRIDFDGVGSPIPEEDLQHFLRQLPGRELLHELRPVDSVIPTLGYFAVQLIDRFLCRIR